MAFASRSASLLARQLGSGPAVASSSRGVAVAAAFSTSSSSFAASEDATARKGPFSSASEASPAPTELNAIGRGRKSAGRGRPKMLPPFEEWIQSDARVYKQPKPGMGPNWIADTPFPLNPSFNPPPPVRQSTKTEIWRLHSSDPSTWTIRALSEKFSIGIQRMEAILRLKALENEWTAQSNMDRLLGAQDRTRAPEPEPSIQSTDKSFRGTQHEEFSEADPPTAPSVIAPALEQEMLKRSSMIAALPSGGPDGDADSSSKVVHRKRTSLAIINVSGDSYKGAGRAERNARRAEKRKGTQTKGRVINTGSVAFHAQIGTKTRTQGKKTKPANEAKVGNEPKSAAKKK
ncbi:uncharacterized protein MEPE_05993 [Melanopsichium pennsylvanicum]|uniref:37S ribosomal protein S35, mitochondrial n=1 Tax=Melanopsichium pennsylvanicum TaxID=63383 RepID=A0AAJ5C870_9BASI|nr:uncharacterized protein MEPE_05993 [Melanopsichium pennsylvanicum]